MGDAVSQAGQLLSGAAVELQPALPGDDFWPPERPDLVELVRKKRPLHTAKIAGKDALLCRALCIDVLVRSLSIRQIALKYGVGRETVTAIMRVMEERGELRPLAQTISDGLGECITLMMLALKEALLRGEYSVSQIPIPMSALIDKKAQIDAGLVPGTDRSVAEVEESALQIAWRARQQARRMAAGDSESDAGPAQVIDVTSSPATSADSATAAATGNPLSTAPDQAPAVAAGPARPAQEPDGRGGGRAPAGEPHGRWDGFENFQG